MFHEMGVSGARGRSALAPALAVIVGLLMAFGNAQGFDANRYFTQCQLFEARGDLETARQFCLNALQVRPDFAEAELVLARVELAMGDAASAEGRLRRVRNRIATAEPLVLLARAALAAERSGEAEAFLEEAKRRLADEANVELEAHVAMLSGQIMQSQGRYDEALSQFARAIAIDPLEPEFRVLDAQLRLRLRDPGSAAQQLTSYIQLTGNDRDPDLRSLLGRALWAQGNLSAAAGHLATAHQLRGARNVEAQAADLRGLALISYAEGDFAGGGLALRESFRRENFSGVLGGNTLLWVLVLLLLVAVHLVGESRISASSNLEVMEGPQPWSVGQIYGTLITALLVGLLVTVLYGLISFENVLALLTPGTGSDAGALFFLTFAVMLALLSWRRVQMNGHDAYEELLGDARTVPYGVGWGLVFLAVTVAYLHYRPFGESLGSFYLDFLQATPLVVAAAILVPLAELFFRSFLLAPLKQRYTTTIATVLSGSLYALAFGTPVLLLLPFGLVLADAWGRRRSGWEPLMAQLTLHIGLLIAVSVSPWVRSLFF